MGYNAGTLDYPLPTSPLDNVGRSAPSKDGFPIFYLRRRPVLAATILYCAVLLALKAAGRFDAAPAPLAATANRSGRVVGVVNAPADLRPTGCFYTIDVETVDFFDDDDWARSFSGTLLLQARFPKKIGPHISAEAGDRVSVSGRFEELPAARVPGAFDYGDFLRNHGVDVLMYASTERIDNMGPTDRFQLIRWGARWEERARRVFEKHLPPREAALLSGLVLGTRPRFHPEMADFFRDSGTMHILVASGSNVAFVQLLWYVLLRLLLRLPRRWAMLSSLPAVWAYVLLVGVDPPIVRAALMSTVGTLAYAIAREDKPYHALALAALAILIPSPRTLFDVGFQMSFLTVFGLLYYLPPFEAWLTEKPWWLKWPLRPIAVSMTAHVWLFPITAAIFRKMAPVAPVANLVVVPLSAGAFVASFLVPVVPSVVAWYLRLILRVVEFFAKHPGWEIWLFPPTVVWLFGFGLLCIAIPHLRARAGQIAGGCGALLLIGAVVFDPHKRVTEQTLTFVDAGRHTWTLVRTPTEKALVVFPQAPDDNQRERLLMPFLMEKRVRRWEERVINMKEPLLTRGVLFFRGLSLKKQDELLAKKTKPAIVVGRFSARMLWRETFVSTLKPRAMIELGYDSARSPSVPPWNAPLYIPQKMGVVELPGAAALKKPDADKAGDKPARVRPPGHAAHLPALRQLRHGPNAVDRLHQKPYAQEKERGNFDETDEHEDGDGG